MVQAGDDTTISGRGMRYGMFAKRRPVDGSLAHAGKLALPVKTSNIVDRHNAVLRFRYSEIANSLSQSHNLFKIESRSPALDFAYNVPLAGSVQIWDGHLNPNRCVLHRTHSRAAAMLLSFRDGKATSRSSSCTYSVCVCRSNTSVRV
jgi:hypothetical protein